MSPVPAVAVARRSRGAEAKLVLRLAPRRPPTARGDAETLRRGPQRRQGRAQVAAVAAGAGARPGQTPPLSWRTLMREKPWGVLARASRKVPFSLGKEAASPAMGNEGGRLSSVPCL